MATTSAAPITIPQINNYYYLGSPMLPTIQQAVNYAIADGNEGTVVIPQEYAGTDSIAAVTSGSTTVYLIDERRGQLQSYYWNGTNYVPSNFEPLGQIIANSITTTDLNATGTITAADIDATDATLATCTVDQSPVRTFANTPDGPGEGMVWPDTGIPVSLGSTWQSPSIDPASLATWPATGIAVSTGTAWGTPIDPATIPRLNVPNVFTHVNTFQGNVDVAGGLSANAGVWAGAEVTCARAATPVISAAGSYSGYFYNDTAAPTTTKILCCGDGGSRGSLQVAGMGPGGTLAYKAYFTAADGGVTFHENVAVTGSISSTSEIAAAAGVTVTGLVTISPSTLMFSQQAQSGFIDMSGASTGVVGALNFRLVSSNASVVQIPLTLTSGGANVTGNFTVTGGTKAFLIPHPLDASKELMHASLEGPENGVYYRGEGVTAGGWADVTLPDYFEALTVKEGRSVMVTALFEEDDEPISTLAASRVKAGKFKVWSAAATQKFYWEVKAVRADIDPLEVEAAKGTRLIKPEKIRADVEPLVAPNDNKRTRRVH